MMSFMLFVCSASWAQTITVKGTVTDTLGKAIAGASVKVVGTAKGTITDAAGGYALSVASDASLEFSYIGFQTVTVQVAGQSVINQQLSGSSGQLDQVVVVGYGSQKKKDITSSIATISVKDVGSRPVISTSEVLAGKAPGVQVVQPSGAPGASFSVRVRGIASPNGAEPLYVIDGVLAGDTKSLDPSTIESISVLKDASAAGIYGAAGSTNGVVLITTKGGSKGRTRTDVNAYTGFQQITKKLDVLNKDQYLALMTDEYTNAGQTVPTIPSNFNANNNWQDLLYHTAMQSGVSTGFSGGSEKGTWALNLGYLNQDGIIHNSKYVRYSANLKMEQNMNNWLSVGEQLAYNRANSTSIPDGASAAHGGTVLAALNTPPIVPIKDANGVYVSNFDGTSNPIANIYDNTNSRVENNLIGNIHAEIKLPFGIKYRTQFGVSMNQFNYNYFLDPFNNPYGIALKGKGSNESSEVFRYTWDNTLTYNKAFGKNSINAVVGSSELQERYYDNNQSAQNFPSSGVPTLNAGSSNQSVSTYRNSWSLMSYFARVNYSYNDRYLFTGMLRRDGSSRVGINNRWGYFPAFSAGWRISKEDFMQNLHFIDDLKLRAGWGETGNLPPTAASVYPSYNIFNPGAPYIIGGGVLPGVIPGSPVGNPNLKWEAGQQTNIGFDVTVLRGRLTLSADYYNKKTKRLIFPLNLPATAGNNGNTEYVNLPGYDLNKGAEFALTGVVVKGKDFNWTSTINMSFNKNRITGLGADQEFYYGGIAFGGNGNSQYATIVKNGLPLGAFWGYVAQGVDPATGNMRYQDLNHDGKISADSDRTFLGSGLPKMVYSFVNSFTYKAFSLDLLFDGVGGNKVFDATRIETEGMAGAGNASTAVLNRWTKAGDITDVPKAIYGDPGAANSVPNSSISTRFMESGAFFRLKAATLSYRISGDHLKNIGIYGIRVYATAQNLFTITKYKGYTPEVNQQGTSSTALGIDYGTYPQAKIYTVGLNVEL